MSRAGEGIQGVKHAARSGARMLFAATSLGVLVAASGCATPAAVGAGYDRCPEGQERVRVGPRGQAPKYICRDAG